MARTGRPSDFSTEKATEICERLADGESLVSICKSDEMPAYRTVFQWLDANPDFARKYARAREIQQHINVERAVIAAQTAADAATGRLAFDAIRWQAGKMLPKVYGDKVQHANADGDGPPELVVKRFFVPLDDKAQD